MFSHIATLILGFIIGYSIAYFHINVDPSAFDSGNAPVASRTQTTETPNKPPRPAGISSLENEINKYVAQKDWDNVISLGEAGLKIQPDFKDALAPILDNAYAGQAKSAYNQQNFKQTINLLNASKIYAPLDGEEWMLQANSHLKLKQFKEAKTALSEAEGAQAISPDAIIQLQREIVRHQLDELLAKNDIEQAIHILELELIGDSSHSPYYLKLAELQYRNKDYQKVIASFDNAVQLGESLTKKQVALYKKAKRRSSFPNAVEVPLEVIGDSIFIDAVLNHNSPQLRFVMDTGASFTTITSQIAENLGLIPADGGTRVMVGTANGVVPAIKIVLESVTVGDAKIDDVETVILDNISPGVDGLLGLSFLKHFNVELATAERLLILKPK